jgi:Carboxypeptidase regulatory-like domain/Beta-propeller repeat
MRITQARCVLLATMLAACAPASASQSVSAPLDALPLGFEVNQGQTDGRVKFHARGAGYELFLTQREIVLTLQPRLGSTDRLRLRLAGSSRGAKPEGVDPLPGKANYFIGSDPAKWRTNVPTFARVRYKDVYPGIDVVYYGTRTRLENDFVVAPGANPGAIALAFSGASTIAIDDTGRLALRLPSGELRLQKAVIYQVVAGAKHEVTGRYVVKHAGLVGFDVGTYDATIPLVIDPVLVYSSYLGGNGADAGNAIAVDDVGNAYVTGVTSSTLFPMASPFDGSLSGSSDVFVSKINAAGSALVFSTYLGGSLTEIGSDISVDGAQNVYVTGRTTSTDFPTMNAYDGTYSGGTDEDAFVTRIDASGSALAYSTYLSGTFGARGFGIAANNSQGYAYVVGTTSTGFPLTASAFEATNFNSGFLTKLCTNCSGAASLVYSTFLAHTGTLDGRSIAADIGGNAYVVGNLSSSATGFASAGAFQTTYGGGSSDVFVAKFNTNLSGASSHLYATFLGGNGKDSVADSSGNSGRAIVIDGSGNAYVTGSTSSTNFPLANAAQGSLAGLNDVFLTKLNVTGASVGYSTYWGGTGDDFGRSVAVNVAGGATLAGVAGPNFPVAAPLPTPNAGVGFVTKFAPSGAPVVYSTILSGVTNGSAGIALDAAGNAFATGSTNASIVIANPFQPINGGGGTDGWVSVIADPTILGRVFDSNFVPIAGAIVSLTGATSDSTTTDANGAYTFGLLAVGGGYTVSVSAPSYVFNPAGVGNLQKNVSLDFHAATALAPGEASPSGHMTATKGAGTAIAVAYTAACGVTRHVVYRGTGPIVSALAWNASYCGFDTSGSLVFDPGVPPTGAFWYFVVVGQAPTSEGPYGKSSAGAQEPEAVGVGACDLPQDLSASCP